MVRIFFEFKMTVRVNFFLRFRRPTTLYAVMTRRSRRVMSSPVTWEPDLVEPLTATMCWPVPDNHNFTVTLFRDARTRELEDKDWTFAIEDVGVLIAFLFPLFLYSSLCSTLNFLP